MAAFSGQSVLQRLRRDGAGARRTKECASCSSTRSSTFSHIARAARSRRSVEDVVELVTSAREEEGVETSSHRRRLLAGMGGLVGSMVVSGIDGASAESESTGYDPNESREANRRENSMAALQGKDYGKTKMRFSDYTLTESGLQYKDLREGAGPSPKKGDRVVIDWDGYTIGYYGRIFEARNKPKGSSFEGSDRDFFRFQVGQNEVIPAFEEAIQTMKVGGIRRLIVPTEIGYPENNWKKKDPKPSTFAGKRSLSFVLENQGLIDKTLLFDIELLKIVQ